MGAIEVPNHDVYQCCGAETGCMLLPHTLVQQLCASVRSKCTCRDAVVGRNCRFLQGPQTDKAEVKRVRDAMTADPPRPISVKLLNYKIDGQPFWNNLHVAPIRSACGEVRGLLALCCAAQWAWTRSCWQLQPTYGNICKVLGGPLYLPINP